MVTVQTMFCVDSSQGHILQILVSADCSDIFSRIFFTHIHLSSFGVLATSSVSADGKSGAAHVTCIVVTCWTIVTAESRNNVKKLYSKLGQPCTTAYRQRVIMQTAVDSLKPRPCYIPCFATSSGCLPKHTHCAARSCRSISKLL